MDLHETIAQSFRSGLRMPPESATTVHRRLGVWTLSVRHSNFRRGGLDFRLGSRALVVEVDRQQGKPQRYVFDYGDPTTLDALQALLDGLEPWDPVPPDT